MAFYNKVGSLLRQGVSQNGQVPMASMFNSARYMSSKLFVGGLSFSTDDSSLKDAFSGFGDVTDAKVITDRDTGRSRGFGFVNFADESAANSAVTAMDGQELNGRNIRVSVANERPPRSGFGGGYGGGSGGGYRGGDGGY
ncbi:glycine-rich RNA-binding protein 2, mitochondrial-like [Argentina anserina]|uniref:glycine-rich RNA-binding protein 2, mitochondrial-like n=1 Tax=Argentina anserina TaxID=57926 RepID=UPI002176549C|nr:glycine-rich RNA-binding protein 2, mitochondrial-like [Potentilla anserina]